MEAGAYQEVWDGNTDGGAPASAGTYTVKLLYNNVQDTWLGVVGNTSASFTGTSVWNGLSQMVGMAFVGSGSNYTAYTADAYEEGGVESYSFSNISGTQTPTPLSTPVPDSSLTLAAVTTDSTNVYYMNTGGGAPDTFVFAIQASNDSSYTFSSGTTYTNAAGHTYSTLDKDTFAPTGISVENSGGILAVSHGSNNSIALFNKTTGASLGTLTDATHLTNPGALAFAPMAAAATTQDLWIISGTSLLHYVNSGTDAAPNYTYSGSITGFAKPLQVAINPVNNTTGEVVVADGGTSQQIKAFNYSGASLWTYGQLGGYLPGGVPSPAVANNKFYLDNTAGNGGFFDKYTNLTFLAFQPDGNSLWVGDGGDGRNLHLTDTGTSVAYSDQIAFLPGVYVTVADPVANGDGTMRIFADYLEFKFNPNVTLKSGRSQCCWRRW